MLLFLALHDITNRVRPYATRNVITCIAWYNTTSRLDETASREPRTS